ncbi:MAG: pyrimidine/purine nucleoside phosphorylase [Gammaproteobacteria bacterium]|nr:pyrimidine/purine nucleoside phosphorylase [Gammaproteobacteria bacterium]MDH5594356.1 pyrimidine/purine nucleoside phosphorylase [Gammaproteobacteria bacterium]
MSEFNNVTVVKKANVYFDGGVTSRTIKFDNGDVKTLGILLPGKYEFNTDKKELMEIQAGEVEVLFADASEWQSFPEGSSFEVPAKSRFGIKTSVVSDYCCSFID